MAHDRTPSRTSGGRAERRPGGSASRRPEAGGTRLQARAGNDAVVRLVGREDGDARTAALLRSPVVPLQLLASDAAERAPARNLVDVLAEQLPRSVASAVGSLAAIADSLGTALAPTAVRVLVMAGHRDEKTLTNLVFWARNPAMAGRAIPRDRPDLAADWLRARDSVVRPALAAVLVRPPAGGGGSGGGGGGVPEGALTGERLGRFGSEAQSEFRRRVYDAQLGRNLRRGREFFPGLPVADLDEVEDGHLLHVSAAADCRVLLAQARADLLAQQAAGDRRASRVRSIGVRSAYRDPARDLAAWRNAFATHYGRTAGERAALPGGPHGAAAVRLMVQRMAVVKAVAGFSNHTRGLAVDFGTRDGGVDYGPRSAQSAAWLRTWLHVWLVQNAGTFHFHPYTAEPWHWDHE